MDSTHDNEILRASNEELVKRIAAAEECAEKERHETKIQLAVVKSLHTQLVEMTRQVQDMRDLNRKFWERTDIDDPSECWIWSGYITTKGYGEMQHSPRNNVKQWRAHRLSYFLNTGDIPNGMVVMHACDNRACVNPAHLKIGTTADNNRDMLEKGRQVSGHSLKTHCKNGHPFEGENLRRSRGQRICKTCQREHGRKHDEKRRGK